MEFIVRKRAISVTLAIRHRGKHESIFHTQPARELKCLASYAGVLGTSHRGRRYSTDLEQSFSHPTFTRGKTVSVEATLSKNGYSARNTNG